MDNVIAVRIPEELQRKLRKVCQKNGISISELIREALKRMISIYHFRYLRKKSLPFAEAQGILTDEDVFKLIS